MKIIINKDNFGRLCNIWIIPLMTTPLLDSTYDLNDESMPWLIVLPAYFGIGTQINFFQVCCTRARGGNDEYFIEPVDQEAQLNDEPSIIYNQHGLYYENDNITNQERMFRFTIKLDDGFLQKLGGDYVCSICLYNQKLNPDKTNNTAGNLFLFDECVGTPCHHYFHRECFKDWANKSEICPLCRKNLTNYQYNQKHGI